MSKVSEPNNEQHRLTLELKRAESTVPQDLALIQKIRADLVLARIAVGDNVRARETLTQFKRTLDDSRDLEPTQAVEFRNKLAFLYISLKDFDAAIKQYTINIKSLEQQSTYEAKLLRARALNDRGVANHLRSETFDASQASNTNLVSSYSKSSQSDFQNCKELLNELSKERPGREQGREELAKILELNQKFYANHLVFADYEARKRATSP